MVALCAQMGLLCSEAALYSGTVCSDCYIHLLFPFVFGDFNQ